jgi:hypothetical protein
MQYELDLFVASLQKDGQPTVWKNIEPAMLEFKFADLSGYINNTREYLRCLLTSADISKLNILVPLTQRDITRGLDGLEQLMALNNAIAPSDKNETITQYHFRLHYMLRRLLEYMFVDFGDYYDIHQKIPAFVIRRKLRKAANFKKKLEKAVLKPGISDSVASLIQSPINNFLDRSHKTSHHQLLYLRGYRKRFEEDNFKTIKKDWDAMLVIISMRLNSYAAVECCLAIMGERLACHEAGSQYQLLTEVMQEVKCVRMANIDPYEPGLPEIHTQLLDHLTNWMMMFAPQKMEEEVNFSSSFFIAEKIMLSFTVDELGLFLRLMNECGMILNENFLNVVRAAIKTFSTKAKTNIAYESLRSKSYKPDPAAAGKLQDKLMLLFNKARDH